MSYDSVCMFVRILLIIGLVSAGLLLVLLNVTTPSSSAAGVVLIVFLLGYIVTLTAMTFIVYGLSRFFFKLRAELQRTYRGERLTLKKSYYYASVIALAPVIVVSLQSVGGVGVYELLLIGLFVTLGCVYIARRTA